MEVMNGADGTAAPTCYSGVEAACSPTPSLHMGKRSRPPSVIDLAVTRSRHSMTHVSKVEVKRLDQKLTDHRMLVVHARVGAGMGGDGAGLMGEQNGRSVPKQAKLRLLPTMAEAVCERIALEVEKATSQWMETWGDVVSAAGRLGMVGSTNTATTATAATAAAWVAAANMAAADAAVVAAKTVKTATAAVTAIAHAARSQVSRTTETASTTEVVIQASTKRSAVIAWPTQAAALAVGLAKDGPRPAAGETVVRATTSVEQSRTEVTATGCSGAAPTAASGNWLLAWSKPNQQILRFERGPTISKLEYFSDRLSKIIGETPDGAIGTLVRYSDDHQALRKYRLVDMVYDIKHGNLVIPELERSPIPPGLKRGVGIVGRHCTSSYRDYIARHYWSIKTGEPKTQKPLGSSFVVSVLSTIKKVYGQEVMESVVDNPVEFAWSTRAVGMERDAVQVVAEHLWENSSSRVGASNVAHLYEGPSYASISPHLRCIRNSSCAHHIYLISGARTGSIALRYILYHLYPPVAPRTPFCPCCRAEVQDTWGHHLNGKCQATSTLHGKMSSPLVSFMQLEAPDWYGRYVATTTDCERAALILAAADEDLEYEDARYNVTNHVADWLHAIVKIHPLCSRQRKGAAIATLQYNDRPYDHREWTGTELARLKMMVVLRERAGSTNLLHAFR